MKYHRDIPPPFERLCPEGDGLLYPGNRPSGALPGRLKRLRIRLIGAPRGAQGNGSASSSFAAHAATEDKSEGGFAPPALRPHHHLRPASRDPFRKRPCIERVDAPHPARRPPEAYPRRYDEGGQRCRGGCSGPRMPGSDGMGPWKPAPPLLRLAAPVVRRPEGACNCVTRRPGTRSDAGGYFFAGI